MINAELQSKLTLWRQKSSDGSITLEEMREAIIALREGRTAAVTASRAGKSSSRKSPPRSSDDLLSELDGLKL